MDGEPEGIVYRLGKEAKNLRAAQCWRLSLVADVYFYETA
jgi:hypothetical protein